MRDDINNYILDLENKCSFYENRLKSILKTIKYITEDSHEKYTKSLNSYKKSAEYILMKDLITKIETQSLPTTKEGDSCYTFLTLILNHIPFPVFIKDQYCRYIIINNSEEELFGIKKEKILGKHDSDFVENQAELDIIIESDNKVLNDNSHVELPNQSFTLKNKRSYVFKTHKIPFINPFTNKRNILGYSVDITDTVNLDKLKKILLMNSPYL